jgi:heme-degrading monooxygenase HmoA
VLSANDVGWRAATWLLEVSGVSERVLSEVSATVPADREGEFLAGFEELVSLPRPDGLLRTELLRGPDGEWRVQTLWRDLEALAATRVTPEPPRTARQVFHRVGAEPMLEILEVESAYDSTLPTE